MKVYGIPDKLIRMVKITYDDFQCSVLDERKRPGWFKVTTGFKRTSNVRNPVPAYCRLDNEKNNRKTWEWHQMELHKYAWRPPFCRHIVLVSSKYEHIQNKTNWLIHNVGRVGLKLNAQKCKATRMEDMKKPLRKAQGAFSNLMKIWNTRSIGRNTKIELFKS